LLIKPLAHWVYGENNPDRVEVVSKMNLDRKQAIINKSDSTY
jgi:hypothetical protein